MRDVQGPPSVAKLLYHVSVTQQLRQFPRLGGSQRSAKAAHR
jgi:hypothetical protein